MNDASDSRVPDEGMSTLFLKAVELIANRIEEGHQALIQEIRDANNLHRECNTLLRQIRQQGEDDLGGDKVMQAMMLLKRCRGNKKQIAEVIGVSTTWINTSKDWAPFRVAYCNYNNKPPKPEDVEILEEQTRRGIVSSGGTDVSIEEDWDAIDMQIDNRQ